MSALIIVDVQKDFCPNGSLAVAGGDEIVPLINTLRETLDVDAVFLTKDWHPVDHCSFVDNAHPGAEVLEKITLPTGEEQILWPRHCVRDTDGAEFHDDLGVVGGDITIFKGTRADTDSYSGFGSAPHADGSRAEVTGLDKLLKSRGIKEVFVVGLAFDHCVKATAIDAANLGYKTTVIRAATRAVSAETAAAAEADMLAAGVVIQ